jgi:hypothetical protein
MASMGVSPSLSVDGQEEGNRREKREPPALDPEDGKGDRHSGEHDRNPHEKATHPNATLRTASARVKCQLVDSRQRVRQPSRTRRCNDVGASLQRVWKYLHVSSHSFLSGV